LDQDDPINQEEAISEEIPTSGHVPRTKEDHKATHRMDAHPTQIHGDRIHPIIPQPPPLLTLTDLYPWTWIGHDSQIEDEAMDEDGSMPYKATHEQPQ